MLGLALAAAVGARDISFANYGDGYLEVVADGILCTGSNKLRLQRSDDSAAVAGTARPTAERRANAYGTFASHDEVVHDSGLFVPEFNTGAGVDRLVSNMWADWSQNGDTDGVYGYKYAPTGMVFARSEGSATANEELAPFLSKLPFGNPNLATDYNYSLFDLHTREPWRSDNGHSAFPGMLPALHPVLDSQTGDTAQPLKKRYAVRQCPETTTDQCCLVVENGKDNDEVNPVPFPTFAKTKLDDNNAANELQLRWIGRAFHTSYSRGLPDLKTYTRHREDFSRLHGEITDTNVLDAIDKSIRDGQSLTGETNDPSNGENELKCRKVSGVGEKSYWAAAWLEHFYTSVVGIEEAGMLRQKTPEYDGDLGEDFKREAENDNPTTGLFQDRYFYNFEDHNCAAQPGGHCGFGYLCNTNSYADVLAKYEEAVADGDWSFSDVQLGLAQWRGYCRKGRWRGRPELLRFEGDGVTPAISFDNYTTLSHVLDGEGDDWYNEEYRMSARLVYTGPDESDASEQGANELPCATTRQDGAYKNVAGDFTRACGKLRATSYEWMLSAFVQTHKYPTDDLHRGANDDGFWWEAERGIGPRPCTSAIKRDKCFNNNRNNRVRLWDIDSSWSLNTNAGNLYIGAKENGEYYNNLKALHEIDGVGVEFLHYGSGWTPPDAPKMTSHGSSDGTSRTNIHSAACHLSSTIAKATDESDNGAKFNAGCVGCVSSDDYYSARGTFWPYSWGTMRAINGDVDWTYPSGCDLSYGPPCNYADAIVDKYHASDREYDWYRGTYHVQGAPGVFGCTEYKDNFGVGRPDWDNPVISFGRKYPTGEHTCSNLANATHFSLEDLDVEEWDMRGYHRHGWGKRNCAYDDGVTQFCTIAAISLNCHNGVNPIDNDHHTFVYVNSAASDNTPDIPKMKAKFVNSHRRILAPNEPSVYSPNWGAENADSVWVNWGKQIQDDKMQDLSGTKSEGDRLSKWHSPYKNGKDDGIVECLRPRDDLLLHSLLKRTWKCTLREDESVALLKRLSPCANPKDYHEWRKSLKDGLFKLTDGKKATGRHHPSNDPPACDCLESGGAVSDCNCGLLARTSRLVVGKDDDGADFETTNKPYAPEWIRNDGDGSPATNKWCKPQASDLHNLGFVPRRACPKANLFDTDFWSGTHTFTPDKIPAVLDKKETKTPFVRRTNAVYSRAELMQMRACVNIEGDDFCDGDITKLGGAPTVSVPATNAVDSRYAVLFEKDQIFEDCNKQLIFNRQGRDDSPLNGLTASDVQVSGENQLLLGAEYCKVEIDDNAQEFPFLDWKLRLDADFTFDRETVTDGLGLYEMIKLQQCLEGSTDCPTVDTSKRIRVTIPVSECPEPSVPSIMYRCYEDNDPETAAVIEGKVTMPEIELDEELKTAYGVRGFEHKMRSQCMDKIQFALECNGKQELHELNNAVCATNGFDTSCEPNVNKRILRADMCIKPLTFPGNLKAPQFFVNPLPTALSSKQLKPFVRINEGGQSCDCADEVGDQLVSRIIVGQGQELNPPDPLPEGWTVQDIKDKDVCWSTIVYGNRESDLILFRTREAAFDSEGDEYQQLLFFNASVCAPTFREVDLHDYRQNIPMHVYWKHCSALQFHFTVGGGSVYATAYEKAAYVAVSRQISVDGGATKFLASLAIPLSVEDRAENEGGTIMWGFDGDVSVRELVPGFCRGTQPVETSSKLFTRDVPFDFEPGEPFSQVALGVCGNDPDKDARGDICASHSGPIFFDNLVPIGFRGGLQTPIATRIVNAQECFLQCKLTANCRTFVAYSVEGQERCGLYADVPKLVRLLKEDTNQVYDKRPSTIDTAFGLGVEGGFGTCIDGEAVALSVFRDPPPPPPRCPSGKTLIPINFGDDDRAHKLACVRSACDPVTEVAVPIVADYNCDDECEELCTGIHESLSTYTTLRPARWTVATPPPNDDSLSYEYADELPLVYQPKFVFVIPGSGQTLLTDTARRLARFGFTLPPVELGVCNPCAGDDTCHHTGALVTPGEDQGDIAAGQPLAVGTVVMKIFGEDETEALYSSVLQDHVLLEGQGPGRKAMQPIVVGESGPIPDDVLLQEYEYVRLEVTVTIKAGRFNDHAKYGLRYNINGDGCACDKHNPGRVASDLADTGDGTPPAEDNNGLTTTVDEQQEPDVSNPSPLNPAECRKRVGNDAKDPAASGMPSAAIKVCTAPRESPEVCVPRTVCKEKSEYVEDEGSLERDRSCARHPVCLDSEYAIKEPTPTTARECKAYVQCTDFEEVKQAGTPVKDFECSSLGRCGDSNEYRDTGTKLCATKTDCALKGQREVQQLSDFADAVCTEYKVVCNEIEYTTEERTLTEEAKCTGFTICEASEFSLTDATVSSDRACKPLQKCKAREIYKGPDSFEEDAVCTPIVRFGFAWVTAGLVTVAYLLTVFAHRVENFAVDQGYLKDP